MRSGSPEDAPVTISRLLAGALLAALVVAAAPTPSVHTRPAPTPAAANGADVSLVGGPDGLVRGDTARSFLDRVRDAASERRPFTVEDALAAHADRLGLGAGGSSEGDATVEADGASDGALAFGAPAGDIDDDGRDDVYAVVSDATGTRIEARRGADGAVLWSRDETDTLGALPVPVGDLDGDGAPDLLLWSFVGTSEFDGDCGDEGCWFRYAYDGVWRYGLASGRDGTTHWETEVPSSFDLRYEDRSTAVGYDADVTVSGVTPWLAPWPTPDAGALGGLVVEELRRVDGSFRLRVVGDPVGVTGRYTTEEALELESAASSIASDGTPTATLAETSGPTAVTVAGVDDLTGDGASEVLLLEYTVGLADRDCVRVAWLDAACLSEEVTSTPGERLRAVDTTGRVHWDVDLGDAWTWVSPLGDVDGDGGTDLLTEDLAAGTAAVRSGADGATRWELPEGILAAVPAGDLDADGAGDVLALRDDSSWEDGIFSFVVERYGGRDGTPGAVSRYEQTYDQDAWFTYTVLGLWSQRELDGDQGSDLAVMLVVADEAGQDGGTTFERGADGSAIADLEASEGFLSDTVDLTGDAVEEATVIPPYRVVVVCEEGDDGEWACPDHGGEEALSARTLPDLATTWTYRPPAAASYAFLWPAGDLDGLPGQELLEQVHLSAPDDAGSLAGFTVRDGLDLGVRWGVGATGR